MKQYQDLLNLVLQSGVKKTDRTGTGTLSYFGAQTRFNLQEGFPLLTTKRIHFKSIAYELLWFIRGQTNTRFLTDHRVTIWNEWADQNGELGRIYGAQWRSWRTSDGQTIDQLKDVITGIQKTPDSRRLIVSAWNPGELDQMALPPCHALFQFYVLKGTLSCHLYQRSADLFLGVPFNIASFALLTILVAGICNLQPRHFIHSFGDLHLYLNHLEQAREQLARAPKELPKLQLRRIPNHIEEYEYEDIELAGYDPHPAIKAPIAI